MQIQKTTTDDELAIRQVHEAAFGPEEGPAIADLVASLLEDPGASPMISLLACAESAPIGHVLITRVRISEPDSPAFAHILAPLAVIPEHQGQGVGSQLVRRGLTDLSESECELVFVLGHPGYYPRFGFQPAGCLGFSAPHPIPEENSDAWMVLELRQGTIGNLSGTVQCADALNAPQHWRE
jgi:predicted N-acetyltransferase YhbS